MRRPSDPGEGQAALQDALRVSFRLLQYVMVVLIVVYFFTGLKIIKQHERGVVLVLGKVRGVGDDRVKGPGLVWTWPKPFAEVKTVVSTEQNEPLTTGDAFWYFVGPGMPEGMEQRAHSGPTLDPMREGYTVTGDVNLLHTRWNLRYTVEDVEAYKFGFLDAEELVRKELRRAVVNVSAGFSIDRALRTDVESFARAVEEVCRRRVNALNLGIAIRGIELLNKSAPLQVSDAFDQVTIAENDRDAAKSLARKDATKSLNEAEARAADVVEEAHAAAAKYTNGLEARADYFRDIRESLDDDLRSFKLSLLLQETLARIQGKVGENFLLPAAKNGRDTQVRISLTPRQRSPLQPENE